ncbi:MAG: hypothetical protein ACRDPR_21230 [Nocardioidaceae bacterium]
MSVFQVVVEGLDLGPQGVVGDEGAAAGHLGPDLCADGFAEASLQLGDLDAEAPVVGLGVLEVGTQRRARDPGRGGDGGSEPVGDLG